MLLLALGALAAPRIVSVGAPVTLDGPGNWPRLFPREEGKWWFVTANQSGLVRTPLTAELGRDASASEYLVEDSDLIDHGWATCPDGSILHVGMGTRTSEQRTAFLRRFEADLSLISVSTVVDDDPDVVIVDQPAVCGPTFQGFGYFAIVPNDYDGFLAYAPRVFLVDADDAPIGTPDVAANFDIVGSSMLERDGALHLVGSRTPPDEHLRIVTLDATTAAVADREVVVSDAGTRLYWPQASVDVDGHTFTVVLQQDAREGWNGQFGDVYLVQFDGDWNVVERIAIHAPGPGDGGFQPGLALRDDALLVVYNTSDRGNEGVVVTLARDPATDTGTPDTGTADTGTPDTGTPDTGTPDTGTIDTGASDTDPADTGTPDPVEGVPPTVRCGCAHGGPADLSFGLAVLALAWTRGRVRRG